MIKKITNYILVELERRGVLFERVLRNRGMLISHATAKQKVIELIQSLYPYKIQSDLIRLGPNGDGGYLIPDDLEGIEACYSPGVDHISEFELDLLNRGMQVYMADASVERPNLDISEDRYGFIKKFVGSTTNESYITMDQWVSENSICQTSELLLQMDIEGGEYTTLLNMSDNLLRRFRIMVIEFHSLHDLWSPQFYSIVRTVMDKILQTHLCVHIHPNNCCGIEEQFGVEIPKVVEFTFIRKDRVEHKEFENRFPHHLDHDNTHKESFALPKNWYKSL